MDYGHSVSAKSVVLLSFKLHILFKVGIVEKVLQKVLQILCLLYSGAVTLSPHF